MWKKFMTGLLMALAVLTLTACGNSTGTASQAPADGAKVAASQGKVLVVYFSASGNTRRVAETIADNQKGTLFEIKPSQPYTDGDLNYRDDNSRVVRNIPSLSCVRLMTVMLPTGIRTTRSTSVILSGGSKHRTSSTPL